MDMSLRGHVFCFHKSRNKKTIYVELDPVVNFNYPHFILSAGLTDTIYLIQYICSYHRYNDETHHGAGYYHRYNDETHHGAGYYHHYNDETHHGAGYYHRYNDETHHGAGYYHRYNDETHHGAGYYHRYNDETPRCGLLSSLQ